MYMLSCHNTFRAKPQSSCEATVVVVLGQAAIAVVLWLSLGFPSDATFQQFVPQALWPNWIELLFFFLFLTQRNRRISCSGSVGICRDLSGSVDCRSHSSCRGGQICSSTFVELRYHCVVVVVVLLLLLLCRQIGTKILQWFDYPDQCCPLL